MNATLKRRFSCNKRRRGVSLLLCFKNPGLFSIKCPFPCLRVHGDAFTDPPSLQHVSGPHAEADTSS
ncbi:hypothetical protein F7725_027136 [Dissostichus mawsoni]|uniref:Uncharacterized protein n=1 Tax=Dissostichus mawsoni TaxID=36200 RepID=A0A7J5XE51_DISMA|nr:hypothetical protein F7725_027136 [Dissostichus mawsoni]